MQRGVVGVVDRCGGVDRVVAAAGHALAQVGVGVGERVGRTGGHAGEGGWVREEGRQTVLQTGTSHVVGVVGGRTAQHAGLERGVREEVGEGRALGHAGVGGVVGVEGGVEGTARHALTLDQVGPLARRTLLHAGSGGVVSKGVVGALLQTGLVCDRGPCVVGTDVKAVVVCAVGEGVAESRTASQAATGKQVSPTRV